MKYPVPQHSYQGFVTLTVTLILIMTTTLLVMTVTHIQSISLTESGNEQRHRKQQLEAQAILDEITLYIANNISSITWTASDKENEVSTLTPNTINLKTPLTIASEVIISLHRKSASPELIAIELETKDLNGYSLPNNVVIRTHGILTPLVESPAPVMIHGCILSSEGSMLVYPDVSANSPISILSTSETECSNIDSIDMNDGRLVAFENETSSFWNSIFTITPDEFQALSSNDENETPDITQRRYIAVKPEHLKDNTWRISLGTIEAPAILLFPESLPCPGIVNSATIIGIVVYEGDCESNPLILNAMIKGTLIVNGNIHIEAENTTLEHISLSTPDGKLSFPVTNAPQIPGTWIDY